jgi:hypothetical protein
MTPTTTYRSKPARGETEVPLDNDRVLTIATAKEFSGRLVTRATVATVRRGIVTFALFADFNEALARSESRATAGNVRRQHEAALLSLDSLMLRVALFYAKPDPDSHESAGERSRTASADLVPTANA